MIKTIFGEMTEENAKWLKQNEIFDYENNSVIAQDIHTKKRNDKQTSYDKPQKVTSLVNYNAVLRGINEPKFYAEACRYLGTSDPAENDRVAYMIANKLFPHFLKMYKHEREEISGTTFLS